jgi:VWA domain-containing protein
MKWKFNAFILLVILIVTGCAGATPTLEATLQPTVTRFPPSATYTVPTLPTATIVPTITATPVSNAIYYLIVLDASELMKGAFGGTTKWDAARESVEAILNGLELNARYGLVVVGGIPSTPGADLCNEPSAIKTFFSSRQKVSDLIGQLEPAGGGSLYTALALAQNQFEGLTSNTIRSLIYITGSSDACSRDQWQDLERQFKFNAEAGLDFHSEIVILDNDPDSAMQSLAQRVGAVTKNVNFQLPKDVAQLRETDQLVITNINNYVELVLATQTIRTPIASSFTLTPRPGLPTNTPLSSSYTLTPRAVTPTLTPSITPTIGIPTIVLSWTPSAAPATQTATASSASSVKLLTVAYLTLGTGCQIDVQVQVSGGPATGEFHVRNSSYDPGSSTGYPQTTLQVGTNWASLFSLNNLLTLPGDKPAYYQHEVWFEYNGVQSNHLRQLVCPGIPPS